MTNLEQFKKFLTEGGTLPPESRFHFPPPIARTLGMKLTAIGEATATIVMEARPEVHANPMGTTHGGVLSDLADLAFGTAHSTTLSEGESFTSLNLQIDFFRPVFHGVLTAVAKPVHLGKTVSRYICEITREDGKVVAQATSTIMTLRGDQAKGR